MIISFRLYTIFLLLTLLAGCSKVVQWGQLSFYQGLNLVFDANLIERHIRAISVYEQATTLAKFDVLWLADEVRTEYAKMHVKTMGKSEEQYQGLLRRQLEENKHFITFYVLSLYENPLGNFDSNWRISLRVNGKECAPTEIKVIELAPEYKAFLDTHLNPFRIPYRVMFDARDLEDALLLREETEIIELIFRSMHKQVELRWDIDRDNRVVILPKPLCEPLCNKRVRMKRVRCS